MALLAASLAAQTASGSGASTSKTDARTASVPSRATVESFLRHTFSYNPAIQWTIKEIKPGSAAGVAGEINLDLKNTQESKPAQNTRIYVLRGGEYAVVGDQHHFPAAVRTKTKDGLPSEAAINSAMSKMLGVPEGGWSVARVAKSIAPGVSTVIVRVNGQGARRFFVLSDLRTAFEGDLIPFGADPFAKTRRLLVQKANGPARGPANAPVTVVEFSDLQCPACKQAQPKIDQLMAEVPNVRLVFQNFPLESIHPWAFRAATYVECVGRTSGDAAWKFISSVYDMQNSISPANVDEKLTAAAAGVGANTSTLKTCIEDPSIKARIWASQHLGETLDVTGTPTVFVNGRKIANILGMDYGTFKRIVENSKK